MTVALSWLLLVLVLVALGAWLYSRFEGPNATPDSAALERGAATARLVSRQSVNGNEGV